MACGGGLRDTVRGRGAQSRHHRRRSLESAWQRWRADVAARGAGRIDRGVRPPHGSRRPVAGADRRTPWPVVHPANSRPDVRETGVGRDVRCLYSLRTCPCLAVRGQPEGAAGWAGVPCHHNRTGKPTMDVTNRRELARRALDGYVSGPAASIRATARALAKVDNAVALVLVEGISDQIALEAAAVGRGRDLEAERVVIVPIGGAHAIGRFLTRLGTRVRLAGLCDLREEEIFRRGLVATHVGSPRTRTGMEHLGFYVCVNDLEDELIRAVGTAGVEALFDSQGDLGSFRSLQSQPAWRGREPEVQMRRCRGTGSRR